LENIEVTLQTFTCEAGADFCLLAIAIGTFGIGLAVLLPETLRTFAAFVLVASLGIAIFSSPALLVAFPASTPTLGGAAKLLTLF
jgi:hypothetical protein